MGKRKSGFLVRILTYSGGFGIGYGIVSYFYLRRSVGSLYWLPWLIIGIVLESTGIYLYLKKPKAN